MTVQELLDAFADGLALMTPMQRMAARRTAELGKDTFLSYLNAVKGKWPVEAVRPKAEEAIGVLESS